jgi:integrase
MGIESLSPTRAPKQLKFTIARLKALPATGERYMVKDTEIPYLQCRVSAAGVRTLSIYRKPRGGKAAVRVKIHNTSTMANIKAEAEEINALLSKGINPNQQSKADALMGVTLQNAFEQYTSSKQLAPGTLRNYQIAMDRMEDWKQSPIREITRLMVLERYNQVAEKSHSAAMKLPQVLRAVWNFQNDLTDDDAFGISPTAILNKQRKNWSRTATRNRKIPRDKLPAWFKAVRGLDSKRMSAYLEFLLLTGLRRREAGLLRWIDVNLQDGYYIVRSTKNYSDHCLPITRRTRELLEAMQGGDLIFGVEEPRKSIRKVSAACSVQFSPHDLRRTFATLADYSGAGAYAIKGILNHSASGDVTALHYAEYKPLDDAGNVDMDAVESMREALQKIEDYILQVVR